MGACRVVIRFLKRKLQEQERRAALNMQLYDGIQEVSLRMSYTMSDLLRMSLNKFGTFSDMDGLSTAIAPEGLIVPSRTILDLSHLGSYGAVWCSWVCRSWRTPPRPRRTMRPSGSTTCTW